MVSITERKFTGKQIMSFRPEGANAADLPNVVGPYNALTKLLIGFATLEQIRLIIPDLCVLPAVLPLVEALFPTYIPDTHLWG